MNLSTIKTLFKSNLIALLLVLVSSDAKSQDQTIFDLGTGIPSHGEIINDQPLSSDAEYISNLEVRMKNEMDKGRISEAQKIKIELDRIRPEQTFSIQPDNETKFRAGTDETVTPDFASGMPEISTGKVNNSLQSDHRQIDMKMAEDRDIYVAVNRAPDTALIWKGRIDIYRSSNNGLSWVVCAQFYNMHKYFNNFSFLVESRDNYNPDSTRIIVFYTRSIDAANEQASLCYATFRRGGGTPYFAEIALPASGYSLQSVSAVSDGAFYANATYFGVVVTEAHSINYPKIRFFRTANWGQTWSTATMLTNNYDLYPSAQFKRGSPDQLFIAVERMIDVWEESQIRILTTTWSPSSSFNTILLTSGNYVYGMPCLTIKQNNPADSMMVTFDRNWISGYCGSYDGGNQWTGGLSLAGSLRITNTWCSSTPEGEYPFTAVFLSGDSIGVRRGVVGAMGITRFKINSHPSSINITPVCITKQGSSRNLSAVAYAGQDEQSVYGENEGHKYMNLKVGLQGFYNPSGNIMNSSDTIKVYLRSTASPYLISDSAEAIINPVTLQAENTDPQLPLIVFSEFPWTNQYIVVKHRNHLETWSSNGVNIFYDTLTYDFTTAPAKAYGNNMPYVDNNPDRTAFYGGDVNQDGTVDLTDLVSIYNDANNFQAGYVVTDVTGDNFIDLSDLTLTYNNSNNFVSVIRP